MKPELVEPYQRSRWAGRTWHHDPLHRRRRPDAQSVAFGPQSIPKRQVKAVQLDARVKVVLQPLHNVGAHDRLGPVRQRQHSAGQHCKRHQQSAADPLQPSVPAPESCLHLPTPTFCLTSILAGPPSLDGLHRNSSLSHKKFASHSCAFFLAHGWDATIPPPAVPPAFSEQCPNAVSFLARMQELIENLVKLQAVELDRARVIQETRALPAELAQAQAALTAAQRQAEEASAALSREESLRTRLEREIAGHRQKTTRFRTQLDSVKTPEQAAAIEHEIRFETAEADRLENEEVTSLESTEGLEPPLAQARATQRARPVPRWKSCPALWKRPAPASITVNMSSQLSSTHSTPSAKFSGLSSSPSGSPASAASPIPEAPAWPASTISSASAAAWAFAPRCGTSSARARCSPATVAAAFFTGIPPWLPPPKLPSPRPCPVPAAPHASPAPQAPKRSLNVLASFYSIFELSVNTTSGAPSIPRPLRNGWESADIESY